MLITSDFHIQEFAQQALHNQKLKGVPGAQAKVIGGQLNYVTNPFEPTYK